MLNRFSERINELESIVRDLAIDITNVTFVEKLPSDKIWDKIGPRIKLIFELIKELKEYLFILKPEKVPTIQRKVNDIYERIDVLEEKIKTDSMEDVDNIQETIEELRQSLVEISSFISLCREVKSQPSSVIDAILSYKTGKKTDLNVVVNTKIQLMEDMINDIKTSQNEILKIFEKIEKNLDELKFEYEKLVVSISKDEDVDFQ
jgi:thiamine kinase-like enzyme